MDLIRRANSSEQLLKGLPYKGRWATLDATSVLAEIMAGPKKAWIASVERMADEAYPAWRELFQQTGKRLPLETRKGLGPAWQARQRPIFTKALLDWLGASTGPEVVADISAKLDAVLEFTIFVTREFLLQANYVLDNHQSDVFDMFQLQYLAFDRYVIVSNDSDFANRTRQSSQADRIMSFDQFLQTL